MEIVRHDRTDPERVFMTFRSRYSTAAITAGQWVAFDVGTAANHDGISVTKPNGANRSAIAGVATHSVTDGNYGLFQIWGYRSGVRGVGGSGFETSKLSAGQPLIFATSGFGVQAFAHNSASVKAFYGKRDWGFCYAPTNTAAIATQAATSGEYDVFIKCW